MPIHRVFIDWCEPALTSTANYLCCRYAANHLLDLQQVIIALPGGRAGRRLLEILVDTAEARQLALVPPRITTVGQLPEWLYGTQLPHANALTQQLAWIRALCRTDPSELAYLTPQLPAENDLFAHLTFVESLMALHRELAGHRLQFADVATAEQSLLSPREICRWQALAAVQCCYFNVLHDQGIGDPQHARLEAIDQGTCRTACDIILVGAVDLNATQRAMLDQVADRVTALIFAPSTIADHFDAYGCANCDAWQHADINLDNARVIFRDSPNDQAAEVLQALADYNGAFAADDITIGVPDARLVPHIEQHLEAHHLPFRYGVGTPVTHSSPCRLLRGVAEFLDSKGFTAFANLARHPAMDQWLNAQGIASSWLEELDDYYSAHLPARLTGRWLPEQRQRLALRRAFTAVEHLLDPLQGATRHPQQWIEVLLELLIQVYGEAQDTGADDTQRTLVTVCEHLERAGRDTFQVPDTMAPRISGAAAIRLLLRALQDVTIPPHFDQSAIELLGWLELPLDDAAAVIVTGLNEGFVPESQSSDLFLPDALRSRLGLQDNARRYARDAYHLSLLAAPRASLTLIVGRRTLDNDVLLPSRLLFACHDDRLLARTQEAFSPSQRRHPSPISTSSLKPGRVQADFGYPRPKPLLAPITSMRVTEFRDYLACPYRYYLRHHLNLRAVDTTAEEMGPPAFGNLLHQVLQSFADSPAAQSDRAPEIRDLLYSTLDDLMLKAFGEEPLPAVRVQAEQARSRLDRFAAWQADRTRQGWRIEHAETEVSGECAWLDIDGEPMFLRGRIDRIDIHDATQQRVLFDYKTGETAYKPEAAHRHRRSEWIDLQLPLYRHLVKGFGLHDNLQLGYITLPKVLNDVGDSIAEWTPADLLQADAVAADIVRQVRAEQFWPPADMASPYDEFAVLCQAKHRSHPETIDSAYGE
jgi:hypothetical protein